MDPRLIRFLCILEFVVCFGVVFVAWPQIGGQEHLDLTEWGWKLTLGVMFSLAVSKATAAAVAGEKPWNARLIAWLLTLAITVIAMGLVTYQAHLNEPADEPVEMDQEEPGVTKSL